MKRGMFIFVVFVVVVFSNCLFAIEGIGMGAVNYDESVLRLAPSVESTPTAQLNEDEIVYIVKLAGENERWFKVTYKGLTGYMLRSSLQVLRSDLPRSNSVLGYNYNDRRRCRVIGDNVCIRYQPSLDSEVKFLVSDRPVIEVYDCFFSWSPRLYWFSF